MATYYIYAAYTGSVTSIDCYCLCPDGSSSDGYNCADSCRHKPIKPGQNWVVPLDTDGGVTGTPVQFWASSNVKSIQTTRIGWICADLNPIATWGVYADLYSDTGGANYVGTILYGHLEKNSRIANGFYNSGLAGKQLGVLAGQCSCSCSTAPHLHWQARGPVTRRSVYCYQPVTVGSSWLYKFVL